MNRSRPGAEARPEGQRQAENGAPGPARAQPPAGSGWQRFSQRGLLYLLVAAGTVIGGVLRALMGMGTEALLGTGFPWDMLVVNTAGSFAIGFYATVTGPDGRVLAGSRQRLFVMAGVCSGFTTFSIFSLDTLLLAQAGAWLAAGLNIGGSLAAWLVAVWAGYLLAAQYNRRGERDPQH